MATEESKLKGARGEKQKQTNEARLREAASGLTNSSQGGGIRRPSRSLTT